MVAASLAGARPLRNNITEDDNVSRLVQLFYRLFKPYCSYSTFPVAFIQALRIIAGLGFTASLTDKAYIFSYQSYFNSKPMANKADCAVQSYGDLYAWF
jgi:hypothetical protein